MEFNMLKKNKLETMTFIKLLLAAMLLALFQGCSDSSGPDDATESTSNSAGSQQSSQQAQKRLFQQGVHFQAFDPDPALQQPETIEVFWYGCGHCKSFAPIYASWLKKNPEVRNRYVPVIWNDKTRVHARAFYLIREQDNFAELHRRMFEAMEDISAQPSAGKQKIALVKKLMEWGIQGEDVVEAFETGRYDPDLAAAFDLMQKYQVTSVPSVIVNRQFRVINDQLVSFEEILQVTEQLLDSSSGSFAP